MTPKSLPLGVLLLGVLPAVASAQGSLNPMVPALQAELAEIERKIESLDCERLRDKAWGLRFEHFTDDQVSACAHTDIEGVLRNNQIFVDNLQCEWLFEERRVHRQFLDGSDLAEEALRESLPVPTSVGAFIVSSVKSIARVVTVVEGTQSLAKATDGIFQMAMATSRSEIVLAAQVKYFDYEDFLYNQRDRWRERTSIDPDCPPDTPPPPPPPPPNPSPLPYQPPPLERLGDPPSGSPRPRPSPPGAGGTAGGLTGVGTGTPAGPELDPRAPTTRGGVEIAASASADAGVVVGQADSVIISAPTLSPEAIAVFQSLLDEFSNALGREVYGKPFPPGTVTQKGTTFTAMYRTGALSNFGPSAAQAILESGGAVGAQIGDVVTGTLPMANGGSADVTAVYGGGQVIVNAQPK